MEATPIDAKEETIVEGPRDHHLEDSRRKRLQLRLLLNESIL